MKKMKIVILNKYLYIKKTYIIILIGYGKFLFK